jgi:NAD(P)-dependent dehydrogenase (short-subunit alcohol dehydrogenase family)
MSKNPFRLDGELALVTGGGTGLGLAISQALVEAGASVVITGRREEILKMACQQLGNAASYIQHDVTELASIPALIKRIERDIQPLDILVNNAGIHLKKLAIDTTDADLAQMMQTHLFSSFALSREAGRGMMARQHGSIIMILSMAALFGIPQVSGYTAAKGALMGLTHALATEFSPHNVRVNGIAPGWIETDMSRKATQDDSERLQSILQRTPMNRMGEPLDIGYAVVYLSSIAAKYVTGVVLPVDGGTSIGF